MYMGPETDDLSRWPWQRQVTVADDAASVESLSWSAFRMCSSLIFSCVASYYN